MIEPSKIALTRTTGLIEESDVPAFVACIYRKRSPEGDYLEIEAPLGALVEALAVEHTLVVTTAEYRYSYPNCAHYVEIYDGYRE